LYQLKLVGRSNATIQVVLCPAALELHDAEQSSCERYF